MTAIDWTTLSGTGVTPQTLIGSAPALRFLLSHFKETNPRLLLAWANSQGFRALGEMDLSQWPIQLKPSTESSSGSSKAKASTTQASAGQGSVSRPTA